MNTTEEPQTHVFLKPCGCLSSAILNVPRMFNALAGVQRYAKNHGETYKLMKTEEVRRMDWACPEHRKAVKEVKR